MSKTLSVIVCGSRRSWPPNKGASRNLTSKINERRAAELELAASKERASNSISHAVSNTQLMGNARAEHGKPARALEFYGLWTRADTRTDVDSGTTRPQLLCTKHLKEG